MGMLPSKTMSTLMAGDDRIVWPIPDSWSLADAATVPVVYGTVIYALMIVINTSRYDLNLNCFVENND